MKTSDIKELLALWQKFSLFWILRMKGNRRHALFNFEISASFIFDFWSLLVRLIKELNVFVATSILLFTLLFRNLLACTSVQQIRITALKKIWWQVISIFLDRKISIHGQTLQQKKKKKKKAYWYTWRNDKMSKKWKI